MLVVKYWSCWKIIKIINGNWYSKKYIINDFCYVGHYINNTITNGFINKKDASNKKIFIDIILSVISSEIITYYQQNKLLLISLVIEWILPTKLNHWRFTFCQ
jgi:hypothetical protein